MLIRGLKVILAGCDMPFQDVSVTGREANITIRVNTQSHDLRSLLRYEKFPVHVLSRRVDDEGADFTYSNALILFEGFADQVFYQQTEFTNEAVITIRALKTPISILSRIFFQDLSIGNVFNSIEAASYTQAKMAVSPDQKFIPTNPNVPMLNANSPLFLQRLLIGQADNVQNVRAPHQVYEYAINNLLQPWGSEMNIKEINLSDITTDFDTDRHNHSEILYYFTREEIEQHNKAVETGKLDPANKILGQGNYLSHALWEAARARYALGMKDRSTRLWDIALVGSDTSFYKHREMVIEFTAAIKASQRLEYINRLKDATWMTSAAAAQYDAAVVSAQKDIDTVKAAFEQLQTAYDIAKSVHSTDRSLQQSAANDYYKGLEVYKAQLPLKMKALETAKSDATKKLGDRFHAEVTDENPFVAIPDDFLDRLLDTICQVLAAHVLTVDVTSAMNLLDATFPASTLNITAGSDITKFLKQGLTSLVTAVADSFYNLLASPVGSIWGGLDPIAAPLLNNFSATVTASRLLMGQSYAGIGKTVFDSSKFLDGGPTPTWFESGNNTTSDAGVSITRELTNELLIVKRPSSKEAVEKFVAIFHALLAEIYDFVFDKALRDLATLILDITAQFESVGVKITMDPSGAHSSELFPDMNTFAGKMNDTLRQVTKDSTNGVDAKLYKLCDYLWARDVFNYNLRNRIGTFPSLRLDSGDTKIFPTMQLRNFCEFQSIIRNQVGAPSSAFSVYDALGAIYNSFQYDMVCPLNVPRYPVSGLKDTILPPAASQTSDKVAAEVFLKPSKLLFIPPLCNVLVQRDRNRLHEFTPSTNITKLLVTYHAGLEALATDNPGAIPTVKYLYDLYSPQIITPITDVIGARSTALLKGYGDQSDSVQNITLYGLETVGTYDIQKEIDLLIRLSKSAEATKTFANLDDRMALEGIVAADDGIYSLKDLQAYNAKIINLGGQSGTYSAPLITVTLDLGWGDLRGVEQKWNTGISTGKANPLAESTYADNKGFSIVHAAPNPAVVITYERRLTGGWLLRLNADPNQTGTSDNPDLSATDVITRTFDVSKGAENPIINISMGIEDITSEVNVLPDALSQLARMIKLELIDVFCAALIDSAMQVAFEKLATEAVAEAFSTDFISAVADACVPHVELIGSDLSIKFEFVYTSLRKKFPTQFTATFQKNLTTFTSELGTRKLIVKKFKGFYEALLAASYLGYYDSGAATLWDQTKKVEDLDTLSFLTLGFNKASDVGLQLAENNNGAAIRTRAFELLYPNREDQNNVILSNRSGTWRAVSEKAALNTNGFPAADLLFGNADAPITLGNSWFRGTCFFASTPFIVHSFPTTRVFGLNYGAIPVPGATPPSLSVADRLIAYDLSSGKADGSLLTRAKCYIPISGISNSEDNKPITGLAPHAAELTQLENDVLKMSLPNDRGTIDKISHNPALPTFEMYGLIFSIGARDGKDIDKGFEIIIQNIMIPTIVQGLQSGYDNYKSTGDLQSNLWLSVRQNLYRLPSTLNARPTVMTASPTSSDANTTVAFPLAFEDKFRNLLVMYERPVRDRRLRSALTSGDSTEKDATDISGLIPKDGFLAVRKKGDSESEGVFHTGVDLMDNRRDANNNTSKESVEDPIAIIAPQDGYAALFHMDGYGICVLYRPDILNTIKGPELVFFSGHLNVSATLSSCLVANNRIGKTIPQAWKKSEVSPKIKVFKTDKELYVGPTNAEQSGNNKTNAQACLDIFNNLPAGILGSVDLLSDLNKYPAMIDLTTRHVSAGEHIGYVGCSGGNYYVHSHLALPIVPPPNPGSADPLTQSRLIFQGALTILTGTLKSWRHEWISSADLLKIKDPLQRNSTLLQRWQDMLQFLADPVTVGSSGPEPSQIWHMYTGDVSTMLTQRMKDFLRHVLPGSVSDEEANKLAKQKRATELITTALKYHIQAFALQSWKGAALPPVTLPYHDPYYIDGNFPFCLIYKDDILFTQLTSATVNGDPEQSSMTLSFGQGMSLRRMLFHILMYLQYTSRDATSVTKKLTFNDLMTRMLIFPPNIVDLYNDTLLSSVSMSKDYNTMFGRADFVFNWPRYVNIYIDPADHESYTVAKIADEPDLQTRLLSSHNFMWLLEPENDRLQVNIDKLLEEESNAPRPNKSPVQYPTGEVERLFNLRRWGPDNLYTAENWRKSITALGGTKEALKDGGGYEKVQAAPETSSFLDLFEFEAQIPYTDDLFNVSVQNLHKMTAQGYRQAPLTYYPWNAIFKRIRELTFRRK